MDGVEYIEDNGEILAILVKESFNKEGISFFTPNSFPLQMGMHIREKGFDVKAHVHNDIYELKNITAQEIFHVQKGKVKVTVFNKKDQPYRDCIVLEGETVFLVAGHSMEFLEDTKMIEFKQGPYRGVEEDKRYLE